MIYLYSGTPGSGKSLHQARDVYNWLSSGRPCITNYEINTDIIKSKNGINYVYLPNFELRPEVLIRFSRRFFRNRKLKEGAIRLYIDEAQLMFNAREWQQQGRAEWLSFFTQHRKYGYDIYLVAQFDRMIDRQVRSLIEYEYIHRKVSNFGLFGKIISLVTGGNLFVSIEMWYPLKEKLHTEWFSYQKKFARIYDTYKDFGVFDDEDNKKPVFTYAEKRLYTDFVNCLNEIIKTKLSD